MNLILLKINDEQFTFKAKTLNRSEKNILESIAQGALDDHPELSDKEIDEIYDWFVEEAKKENMVLDAVSIDLELKIQS